jgi:peroxiredoxin
MEEPRVQPATGGTSDGGALRIWAPFATIVLIAGVLIAAYAYRRFGAAQTVPQSAPRDLAQEARADLEQRNFRPLSAPLAALLDDPKYESIPTQAHLLLLQPAPDFTLRDVDGKEWSLEKQLKDGPVVLVFYYGYHCNHCVSQLFALDKDIEKFRELGVQMVAVSADPAETTRERFKKYGAFMFPVLSDPGNKVAALYETYVPNPVAGQEGDLLHGTFVISRQGKVIWANRGDRPFTENHTLLLESARTEGRLPRKSSEQ